MRKKLQFPSEIRIILRKNEKNAKNILGTTAYYNPEDKCIVLYTTNRHPKDILRSFAHEFYHSYQHLRGDFDDLEQYMYERGIECPYIRKLEAEAYEQGNLILRDWEQLKKEGVIMENQEKKESVYDHWEKRNERLGEHILEKWGYKKKEEIKEEETKEEKKEEKK